MNEFTAPPTERRRFVILEQYGRLAGGQTVANQLIDLLSPHSDVELVGPSGDWFDTLHVEKYRTDEGPFNLFMLAVQSRGRYNARTTVVINGPRAVALALLIKMFNRKVGFIYYLHNRPSQRWMQIVTRALSRVWDLNVSVAADIADLLSAPRVLHNCARVTHREYGKQHELAESPTAGKPVLIKFMGRSDSVKGLDVLEEAARHLAKMDTKQPWRLEIAVSSGLSTNVPEERIILDQADYVSAKSATWLLSGEVLCVPSRFEASPLVVHEAMARGVLVVASNAGGTPEIVDNSVGYLFESENSYDLALTLKEMIDNSTDRYQRTLNALKRADSLAIDWESFWLGIAKDEL